MYRLFDTYYDGASRLQFERDLSGKTHVIELVDGAELRGFSTLAVFDDEGDGRARIIYSGDTIIHHSFWGEQALALAFCRFAGTVSARSANRRVYWLLISKGHRTYRYLSLFAHRYHPHHAQPAAPEIESLLQRVAAARFGSAYDKTSGIVRFGAASTRLRSQWHDVRPSHRRLPDVAFFLERNPGYQQGDELVCLCELESSNLRSFALRAFVEGRLHANDDVEERAI